MRKKQVIAILTFCILTPQLLAADSVQNSQEIKTKIVENKVEAEAGLSTKTKRILDDIYKYQQKKYQKKTERRYLTVGDPLDDDFINLEDYETKETSRPQFDLEIKSPGKKLQKKFQMQDEAYVALISGQYEIAIILYQKILDKYRNDETAMIGLASAYHRLGEVEEARNIYARTVALYPENINATNNFLILVAEESPQEALREFLRIDSVSTDNAILKAQISYIYFLQENFNQALIYIQQALDVDKGNPRYVYNKAIIMDNLGLRKDALRLYRKLYAAKSYIMLGISQQALQNRIMEVK